MKRLGRPLTREPVRPSCLARRVHMYRYERPQTRAPVQSAERHQVTQYQIWGLELLMRKPHAFTLTEPPSDLQSWTSAEDASICTRHAQQG